MIFLKTYKTSYDENDVPEETFLGLGSQRDEDDLLSQVDKQMDTVCRCKNCMIKEEAYYILHGIPY